MRTAQELQITQTELDALIKVRDQLAKGAFAHGNPWDAVPAPNVFNMGWGAKQLQDASTGEYRCGSTCCIGGWMHVHMAGPMRANDQGYIFVDVDRANAYVNHDKSPVLHPLFFPLQSDQFGTELPGYEDVSVSYTDITPEHAIRAIDNFLETGDPDWPSILKEAGMIEVYDEEETT